MIGPFSVVAAKLLVPSVVSAGKLFSSTFFPGLGAGLALVLTGAGADKLPGDPLPKLVHRLGKAYRGEPMTEDPPA